MLQHLLLGMLAPLGLVMAAPITLVLRSVPARLGRGISRLLRSRYLQVVANPITALCLIWAAWRCCTSARCTWR